MAIKLTTAAAERIRSCLERESGAVGLRVGVRRNGCSGLSYTVDYADTVGAGDKVFDCLGVKVIVDQENLRYIDGTEIDFREQDLFSSFYFNNPNETGACGCGESFTVS